MSTAEQISEDTFDPKNHSVLIIDDVPANLSIVAENLAQTGFQIKIAINGESGLKIAQGRPPALILLDVYLPDLDGFEVCRRLKADERTREIPVIFMTAMDQTENKLRGFKVGGVDYITKPVNHQEVIARVTMQIRFRELTRKLKEAKLSLEQRVLERTSDLARVNESLKKEIIERENTQAELVRSEREYRSLAENFPDNIIRYDQQCSAIYCNPSMEQTLGLDAEIILGKTPFELAPIGVKRNSLNYENNIRQVLENGKPAEIEQLMPHSDGTTHIHQIRFVAERDALGNIVTVLAIGRDITERKKDEAALKHLNRELRALSDCNQVLVRAVDEQELLDDICRIICDEVGYYLAWVGFRDDDESKNLQPAASAGIGIEQGYLERLQEFRTDSESSRGLSEATIRRGEITCVNDLASEREGQPWRDFADEFGVGSAISLPLKDENQHTFGVLNIYSTEIDTFTEEEQRLLSELAEDLAFGIVTMRRRIKHDKAEEQVRIAATAFEAQEGIVITDAKKRILRVNAAFTEITGYTSEEAVGATPSILKSGQHDDAYYQKMWEHISQNGSWQDEIWNRRKNGEIFPEWLNITAVHNDSGEVTHYVGTMTDITERKAAAAEIEHLAYHDVLTLLPNRRLLLDRLEQALPSSERNHSRGALVYIDLDNFKVLNDTRGHDVGDQLLIEVADRLLNCVRKEDTLARFGGDEFMIMLKDLGQNPLEAAEKIKRVGEKIVLQLSQPYKIAGQIHHITPSIGITLFVGNQNSVQELLKQAEIAMYQAKNDGRNTLRYFDPQIQALLSERAALEIELRRGIEQQQFIVHYQAQVDNKRGIIGAEILIRWNHPEQGLVSPDQFIPLAEESGLILPIGQWVLESACKQLKTWAKDPRCSALQLAVNVSQYQFQQVDFVEQVQQVLEQTQAPPGRLKLELTESLLINDIEDSIKKMNALKALGVEFSLDDFGTGYSSLSYLTRLPLKQLKIDRSFIDHLPDNHNDAVVTQTIITMAQSLGLSVIAEGVETEAQRQFLEQHGCTTYQGFFFSKPVILHEFEELIARQG
jgi:diguanylate cyclase (GGDEF)-like protein/PAS domain S-box-containing protein